MSIEEKYQIALATLQAISTRAAVVWNDGRYTEWEESSAMQDMARAARYCLNRLGEESMLPSYLKKRERSKES